MKKITDNGSPESGENLKWKENLCFSGKIRLLTGLHIGAGGEALKIGGVDSPVITTLVKNKKGVIKEMPYIPGSSLKGKLRKMADGISKPELFQKEDIETFFGTGKDSRKPSRGATRIIIRDSFPTEEWIDNIVNSDFYDGGLELKGENWIKADGVAKPRFIQRVIPDVEFKVDIIVSLYKSDTEKDEKRFIDILKSSMGALEDSYLGGSGTRGYGRVEIIMDFNNPIRKKAEYYMGK
ncbi:MAG: type III-A CRISPR-associated RAMP protein Csm3 [Thermoplasmataceae archaeon]